MASGQKAPEANRRRGGHAYLFLKLIINEKIGVRIGLGVFLPKPNLTSQLFAIYHPKRWDETKPVRRMLAMPAQQKRSSSFFGRFID
jgi:hypothetical protein